jgi:hypothetical protein
MKKKTSHFSLICRIIQGDSCVAMSPTELKMQPTIHLERKAGYGRGKYPALRSKCIVGCILNSLYVSGTTGAAII